VSECICIYIYSDAKLSYTSVILSLLWIYKMIHNYHLWLCAYIYTLMHIVAHQCLYIMLKFAFLHMEKCSSSHHLSSLVCSSSSSLFASKAIACHQLCSWGNKIYFPECFVISYSVFQTQARKFLYPSGVKTHNGTRVALWRLH